MHRTTKKFKLITVFSVVFLSVTLIFSNAKTAEKTETVVILHTNDLHFDYNYLDQVERTIQHYRDNYDTVFLVDAGDMFVRHPDAWDEPDLAWYQQASEQIIQTMNRLKYDVAVLGNHEVDYKENITRDSLLQANFPLISANLKVTTDQFIQPQPYIVLTTRQNHTITLIGLSRGQQLGIERIGNKTAIENYLYLREQTHVLGLLSHIGFERDQLQAERFPQLDLIVGGHSHTALNPAVIHNGVLIAQTGGHDHEKNAARPQQLGVIKLVIKQGELLSKEGKLIILNQNTQ